MGGQDTKTRIGSTFAALHLLLLSRDGRPGNGERSRAVVYLLNIERADDRSVVLPLDYALTRGQTRIPVNRFQRL